jgi:TolB-like protein/thioredoxin-like negative regulator of GroEL
MEAGWLRRLKQRNVFRATVLYAVTGYAIYQIANTLMPALGVPRWVLTLLVLLYLAGFPLVAGLTYAFEYRDGALHRAAAGPRGPVAALGWFDWTLLGLAAAMFLFASAHFGRNLMATSPTSADAAPQRSVAVLPFANYSGEPDGEYFADGLTEEIINGLAQIPDLRVAGRTSSFYFKGRAEDLREVGRKLGVAHVVEGSVRVVGGVRRITAQLVSVADGFHVWSENFDFGSTDLLVIQTNIARAVAAELKLRLVDASPTQQRREPATVQLELVALSRLRKQELPELQAAREQFARLRQLEPDNPRAHTGYAEASLLLAQNFLALDFDHALQESAQAIQMALTLAPDLAEAWRVKGLIERVQGIRASDASHDAAALAAFQRAADLDPANSDALTMLATQRLSQGQSDAAISLLQQALGIDPLSRLAQRMLGETLANQGRFAEAEKQYRELVALYPEFTDARGALADLYISQGQLDSAARTLNHAATIHADPYSGLMLAGLYANLDMQVESNAVLARIQEPPAAVVMAGAASLLLRRDHQRLLEFTSRQLAASRDPVWRSGQMMAAVMLNDLGRQRALATELNGGLRRDPPVIAATSPLDALLFATALRRIGDTVQAGRILQSLLDQYAAKPGRYDPPGARWIRALARASRGDTALALDELEGAEKAGFRTLVDLDYFQRLEDYPFMEALRGEPRFQQLLGRIRTDNLRMREALARPATTP